MCTQQKQSLVRLVFNSQLSCNERLSNTFSAAALFAECPYFKGKTAVHSRTAGQKYGYYNLQADATGSVTLQQNTDGNFIIPKVAADTNFYIQLISGSCSALVVKVNIKVVDKSYFAIPNAFTPNGDGINDRLSVKVIGSIELDYFKNQQGELVYESHWLNDGWDGIYRGIFTRHGRISLDSERKRYEQKCDNR